MELNYILLQVLKILLTVLLAIVVYCIWSWQYWKNRNIPYIKPFGFFLHMIEKVHIGQHYRSVYNQIKSSGFEHGAGIYLGLIRQYMAVNPEVMKNVMLRDFQNFTDRGIYYNEKDDPLSAHFVAAEGEKWQPIRNKLTPAFTPLKLKMMFNTFLELISHMENALYKCCQERKPVDIKHIAHCFMVDTTGSCIFGIECNSFKYPDAEFRTQARRIIENVSGARILKTIFAVTCPNFARRIGIQFFDKTTNEFFSRIVKEAVTYRKDNQLVRNDLLQPLIDSEKVLDNTELLKITAHAFAVFTAGFESSASTLVFCLYELAVNMDIQQKLRDEIKTVLAEHNGNITYDAVKSMKYLSKVYKETLRKYPAVSFTWRRCLNDYKIANSTYTIEKDIPIVIPILAVHYDPEYYPDPETFDPERFSEENNKKRVPCSYIPFGEGPRNCVGLQFGNVVVKTALVSLLKEYVFSPTKSTPASIKFDRSSFTLTSKDDILLNIEKIDE